MEPWVWAVGGTLGLLAVGGFTYAIVDLFRGNWPREGDRSCSVETYRTVLGRHNAKPALADRAWQYMPLLRHAAAAFDVDPTLLAGLVHTESTWVPTAGSHAGAIGLTQYIKSSAVDRYRVLVKQGKWPFDPVRVNRDPQAKAYFASKGVSSALDRTDPKQSLWLGAAGLRANLNAGKGVEWALAAYNGGPAVANKPVEDRPKETQAYVPGVLKRQRWYQELDAACRNGLVSA